MNIHIENLGVIKNADVDLADLTIICGMNNTGKTYVAYSLFGFLEFWNNNSYNFIKEPDIKSLIQNGHIEIKINKLIDNIPDALLNASEIFSKRINNVFATSQDMFSSAVFRFSRGSSLINIKETYQSSFGVGPSEISVTKESKNDFIQISSIMHTNNFNPIQRIITRGINQEISKIIFNTFPPNCFIVSAERTGSTLFRKELDLFKIDLVNKISEFNTKDELLESLFNSPPSVYPSPIEHNLSFLRSLEKAMKEKSIIAQQHPDLFNSFSDILGGEYKIIRDELYYISSNKRFKMSESSSSIRALLILNFYLKHIAKYNDLLIIDEPELNLHPENQRRIARLLAHLINVGVKVLVTTHSDYIVRELNILLSLNQNKARIVDIREKYGYSNNELLRSDQMNIYVAEEIEASGRGKEKRAKCFSLRKAPIDPIYGIEVASFDKTINDMNYLMTLIARA